MIDSVVINITNICRLSCTFCAKSHIQIPYSFMMTDLFFITIVNKLIKCGIVNFDLTPVIGDPLSDHGLIDKLRFLNSHKEVKSICFSTNLIDAYSETLKSLNNIKKLHIDVSVYGYDEKSYTTNTQAWEYGIFIKRLLNLHTINMSDKLQFMLRAEIKEGSFIHTTLKRLQHLGYKIYSDYEHNDWCGLIPEIDVEKRSPIEDCASKNIPIIWENGDVGICSCWDIHKKSIIGNIIKEDFNDIMKRYSKHSICKNCTDKNMEEREVIL